MMKAEFEDMIQSELTSANWEVIELVYMWHPRFEQDGKTKAAEIWKLFGTSIFREMKEIALQAKGLRQKVESLRSQLQAATLELKEFSDDWN